MWTYGDDSIRQLWNLDPNIAFLNHGSYGSVPNRVLAKSFEIQNRIERNPVAFLSRELPNELSKVRSQVSQWLNTDPNGLAFLSNATTGVGAVLTSLELNAGDEIVFHNHGYGWVRQGLENLARSRRIIVREAQIPFPPKTKNDVLLAFEKVITHKTKLVICDHITSPTALIFPVKEIVELAHNSKVPVLVDGAHAPGFLELDLNSIDADFYTGNFHKWLCAPRGSAFLFVQPQWRNKIKPQSLSYQGGVTHHHYDQSFTGYFDWNGTNQFASWLTIPEAIQFHEELGWERIFKQRKTLLKEAQSYLTHELSLTENDDLDSDFLGAMITLPWRTNHPTVDIHLARALTQELFANFQIEIPFVCFQQKLFFRLSAQIYNRWDEIEKLNRALKSYISSSS